jgi:hypothetical protein
MSVVNILDYRAGDSMLIEFTVRDEITQRPLDLTGATVRWGVAPVRNARTIGAPVVTLTQTPSTSGVVEITAAAMGKLRVSLSRGALATPGDYVHELEIRLASGQALTAADGQFKTLPAIFTD